MTYTAPGTSATTIPGAVVGGGPNTGLVVAIAASFPKGPASPTLVGNVDDVLGIFGNDQNYNDIAGYKGPGYVRVLYQNAGQIQPKCLIMRAGVVQPAAALANGGGTTGAWTATAVPAQGGSVLNGTTLVLSNPSSTVEQLLITPPSTSGLLAETYTLPVVAALANPAVAATLAAGGTSQVATPAAAPTLAAQAGTTGLLGGTYTVGFAWRTAAGATALSPTANITITAGQQILVTTPALPGGVTSVDVFMSQVVNSATVLFAANTATTTTTLTAIPLPGSVAPNATNLSGSTQLAAGVYTVNFAWRSPYGSTLVSTAVPATVTLVAGQYITVTLPALPTGAVSTDIYLSPAPGNATVAFDANTAANSINLTAVPASGAAVAPAANTSGTVPTWAGFQQVVNPASKIVSLTLAGLDGPAQTPATGTYTLVGGADGANATAAQVNAAMDAFLPILYSQQPIHILAPVQADGPATGVTAHALGNALQMQANGQRPMVIGSAQYGMSVAQLVALAGTLVPNENGGDSGRCVLCGNWAPYRTDPATGLPRQYPPEVVAAALAGLCASTPLHNPRGHKVLQGFLNQVDGFQSGDRLALAAAGVLVADASSRIFDAVTTAIQNSYRRDISVQQCEDFWVADLQNDLNLVEIEGTTADVAGNSIDTIADLDLQGYIERKLMSSYKLTTLPSASDQRNFNVNVTYVPKFPVRNIAIMVQMSTGPNPTAPTFNFTVA